METAAHDVGALSRLSQTTGPAGFHRAFACREAPKRPATPGRPPWYRWSAKLFRPLAPRETLRRPLHAARRAGSRVGRWARRWCTRGGTRRSSKRSGRLQPDGCEARPRSRRSTQRARPEPGDRLPRRHRNRERSRLAAPYSKSAGRTGARRHAPSGRHPGLL